MDHIHDDRLRDRFYEALDVAGLGDRRQGRHPMVFHDRHTFGTLAVEVWPLHRVQACGMLAPAGLDGIRAGYYLP